MLRSSEEKRRGREIERPGPRPGTATGIKGGHGAPAAAGSNANLDHGVPVALALDAPRWRRLQTLDTHARLPLRRPTVISNPLSGIRDGNPHPSLPFHSVLFCSGGARRGQRCPGSSTGRHGRAGDDGRRDAPSWDRSRGRMEGGLRRQQRPRRHPRARRKVIPDLAGDARRALQGHVVVLNS